MLSVGEGVRQGGSVHSCKLSSRGRISKTLSTTGDEVFFKLATASPRVTPVKSIPFTFNKMSPAQGGSRQYSLCSGLTNTSQDFTAHWFIIYLLNIQQPFSHNTKGAELHGYFKEKPPSEESSAKKNTLPPTIRQLKEHVGPARICKCKKYLFQYTNMFPNHTKGHSCCTAVSYIKYRNEHHQHTQDKLLQWLVFLWGPFVTLLLHHSNLPFLVARAIGVGGLGGWVITDWIRSCCKTCGCTGFSTHSPWLLYRLLLSHPIICLQLRVWLYFRAGWLHIMK